MKVIREDFYGDSFTEWCEIQYVKPITEDLLEFADTENPEFLNKEG
jgi:hypothetical protein